MPADEYIDGNAAAGALGRIFAVDVTAAMLTCDECERKGPVGELQLYGSGPGQVLRCASCGTVNLRIVEIRDQLVLDLRGCTKLIFTLPVADTA
ncbi:DUF6510 family protein [Sphingomonas sp. CARO-RG-8B-R24-01]|uniref:DUF6510 family protein n=1 Tax=Sphingomonas sp. CARO-RG-8B-R24-01 TaxID=2914831 RepID=UPI001F584F9C|nr:DUF6510 family protein [Sphingomonas sp. CARO-RG-8B-R24-01]